MTLKTQIKKEFRKIERYELEHRSTFERAGALVLTAATVFNLLDLTHDSNSRQARKDITVNAPAVLNSARENETMRLPVKLDDGIRAAATTGE